MTHQEKLDWMRAWCQKAGVMLDLDTQCGFGRECVGIVRGGHFPDYEWLQEGSYERADNNGKVWTPPDAYHKHPCVAVLGLGETAEAQLYDWLKWFDDNGFRVSVEKCTPDPTLPPELAFLLGKHFNVRMVKG